jgi:hypothetical protein
LGELRIAHSTLNVVLSSSIPWSDSDRHNKKTHIENSNNKTSGIVCSL